MTDVFEVLGADHREVKSMLSQLSGGGSQDRKKLAEKLVMEESKHEAVEEMYFWPAVRESVSDGDQLAEKAVRQEDEGKQILDDLDKAGGNSAEFEELISTFTKAAMEHIAFEEDRVWPGLRSALDAQAREQLGTKIEQAKKTAPTRPHPHAPDSPGSLKTAGAAAAAADKVRDKLSGRGD
jgi:hemerythrin superfamily protein